MGSRLEVRRLGYALGAEVRGVDLKQSLDAETVAAIRRAWLDHLVLCFPGQVLTMGEMTAFASRFGTLDTSKFSRGRDLENTAVTYVTNKTVAGRPFDGYKGGQSWHSDSSYMVDPPPATFLYAKEIPEVGGNTIFANQYMAYETLSATMRGILDGLSAVHDHAMAKNRQLLSAELQAKFSSNYPPVVHSVVKVHPETKRKSLYLGERVRQFDGMSIEEGQPLLEFLNTHAVAYEFTYRHAWRLHDLLIWDNRCTMHLAVSDYDLQRDVRHMWRATLQSEVTGRLCNPDAMEEVHALSRG